MQAPKRLLSFLICVCAARGVAALSAPAFVRAYHGATSSNHQPSWNWTATGATEYLVTLSGSPQVTTSVESYSPPAALADGTYTLQVRARAGGVVSDPATDTI